MIEKIYKKKTKTKKVIYEKLRLSHTPNVFCVRLFKAAYFCTLQSKTGVSRTRNECLRGVLRRIFRIYILIHRKH